MLLRSSASTINGTVLIPSSKSHTVRALMFGLLADGTSTIRNPLDSGDTQAAIHTVRALGATVNVSDADWTVTGVGGAGNAPDAVVDVLNSGTTLYIAMSIAANCKGYVVFTGDDQIRRRPAGNLVNALRDLGATAFSTRNNGCAPLVVGGPLKGGTTTIECPTSQYLTSLLIGTALGENDSHIRVPLLHEQPYVHMTLRWLDDLGIRYRRADDLSEFTVPGGQKYPVFNKRMAGDFSSATFFLCGAAMAGGTVLLEGLDMADTQGDKAVVDYLRAMGVRIDVEADGLRVHGGSLKGAEIDLNATPDALPAMAAMACFADGVTKLVNVPQARLKETDRIAVMAKELSALGARVTERPDGLEITGGTLKGGRARGHADHRVVMALCLAGLRSQKPVEVDTAEAVSVTFPTFPERLSALGGRLEAIDD